MERRGSPVDIRQYGPALFPTLKQVRRLLDEGSERRRESQAPDSATGSYDESGAGIGK